MTVDISTEYLSWDNVETVTCTANINGRPQQEKKVTYALRVSPRDRRSSFAGTRTSAREVTFWLPIAEFGTKEPDGELVIEDSEHVKYSLLESKRINLGSSDSHWDVLATRFQDDD